MTAAATSTVSSTASNTADEGTLVITRTFDAPIDRVFDAWMTREQWQSWVGPEGINCEVPLLEPHVGGRYRVDMRMSTGEMLPVSGVYREIVRPTRIVFTWGWEGRGPETLVTISLRDVSGKTELTLRHEGLLTAENRDGHDKGWNSALNKLGRYVASR